MFRLREASKTQKTRVILALDKTGEVTTQDMAKTIQAEALSAARAAAPFIAAVKINYPLVLATGLGVIRQLREIVSVPIIADFKVADIDNTNRWIAKHAFAAGADAIITHVFTGFDSLKAVIEVARSKGGGVIAVPNMSHPGASQFIKPLSYKLSKLAGESGVSGVIAPATRPLEVAQMREWLGEDMIILCPGVGAQGGQPGDAIRYGADFEIIGRSIYDAQDIRASAQSHQSATWKASRDASLLNASSRREYIRKGMIQEIALEMHAKSIIKFGRFTLASGKLSPYYIDLRLVPSHPTLFSQVINLYLHLIRTEVESLDGVAGIPTAGISFATAIAADLEKPLLYIRTKPKDHGRQQMVEGQVVSGERVVLIDDLITDGGSKLEVIGSATAAGLRADHVVVLLDRLQGGKEVLADKGISLHTGCTILEVLDSLRGQNKISDEQNQIIRTYIRTGEMPPQ